MAEAALVITLNVPITFRFWMNWNGARSWGEPSRLITRPTQPVPAQLTAMRRLPPSAAWSTAFWQSSGSVTSPPDEIGVGPDLTDDFLAPLLVPVEHGDPDPDGGELAGGGLAEARGPAGDDCGTSLDLHARRLRERRRRSQNAVPAPGAAGPSAGPAGPCGLLPAAASVASRSTTSFIRSPEWPLTQSKVTGRSGSSARGSSSRHRSWLATGFPWVLRQPRRFHPTHHCWRKQLTT